MSSFLKRYRVTLSTRTPVFIGSGQVIGKREYIRYLQPGKVAAPVIYFPDTAKLYEDAVKHHKGREYEQYVMSGQGERRDLGAWCKTNGLTVSEEKWGGYTVSLPKLDGNVLNEIHAFVKDAYGLPYIPGSSLKGMLRTIIARGLVNDSKPDSDADVAKKFQILKDTNGERLTPQLADFMRGIRIADSAPLSTSDLTICQKIDLRAELNKQTNRFTNDLPTFKECLKPGVKATFDMTVDTKLLSQTGFDTYFDKTIRKEKGDISCFDRDVTAYVLKYHKYRERFNFQDYAADKYLRVYLGGGAGFHTKTVHNPTDFKSVNSRLPKKMGRIEIRRKGLAPSVLKCTEYGGKLMEMGQCSIAVEEVTL
jgi:CRISPR-associated protein Csm5